MLTRRFPAIDRFDVVCALIVRGCDEAQGYYYARALSPVAFEVFMQDRIESSFAAEIRI